jgi:MFS family permease
VDAAELSAHALRVPAILRPLRDPALALLWGGLATSAVGDQLFAVALAWIAVGVLGTAAGYLTALQAACVLATALLGGRWADRRQHRRLMVAADLARTAILGVVVLAWLLRGMPPGWTLVLAVVGLAAGQALFRPALQALVPVVVPERSLLPAANALLDTTDRIARLLGPGIVGMLSGVLPLVHFVTLDAATFLASALALVGIGRLRTPPDVPTPARETALESALRGFVALRRLPLLGYMLATSGIVLGCWYAAMFLGIPLLLASTGGGLGGYGLVIACYGSTNLLSTLVVGSRSMPERPAAMIFAGLGLVGCGTALIGVAGLTVAGAWLLPTLCAAAAFGAIGGPMEDVAIAVLRQTRVPPAEQAAVMRAFLVSGNLGMLVAFLAAPRVFDTLGAAATVMLCGTVLLVVAGVGIVSHRNAAA